MAEGVATADIVFAQITAILTEYLRMLERSEHTQG